MDNQKVGELIRKLRRERGLTQLQLAQMLHVSDKAVSKWERGMGSPEVALLEALSRVFQVDVQNLLSGELNRNTVLGGNPKRMQFYVCPDCGNLVTAMADAAVTCCGRKLKASVLQKAAGEDKLMVERIENDWFITAAHEMTKAHHITFVALLTSDTILLKKQYPEWDLQVRLPVFAHGLLLWHCSRHGLFYQVV